MALSMAQIVTFAISFLGLIAGHVIALNTKDELKPGRKYFIILKKLVIIALIVLLISMSFKAYLLILVNFLAGMLIAYVVREPYFFLGIISLVSILANKNPYLVAGMIFVFGLAHGTLNATKYIKKQKNLKKILLVEALLFLAPLLLLFYEGSLILGSHLFLSFASGGLFFLLIKKQ